MTNNELWQAVLAELELLISKANFNTWFKNTGIACFQDGQVVLCVPNTFNQAWIEKKYHHQIIKSLERVTGKPVKKMEYKIENIKNIELTTNQTCDPLEQSSNAPTVGECGLGTTGVDVTTPIGQTIHSNKGGFPINPKNSFASFVVGSGSELAFAAAQAVANRPGEAYNPLFIYGGVGLGKTHLIQAIGNEIIKNRPNINILYVSAEKFSNDFISSVKDGNARDFQNQYRLIDILLIDDIQFIAGKDRTQESFFHTFNELHQQSKQVILTSDRPPKAIPALEDRLKSRFEWGMIVDISPPDFETRVAILEKKCAEKKFILDSKILNFVATAIQSNIRELEGALNKIIAFHQLKQLTPSLETVKPLFSGGGGGKKSVTAKQIIGAVADFYNINTDDVLSKNREKRLSFPRQIIMFLLREELKMSYPSIGDELGGRDHTTAMHACEKIIKEIENDIKLRQEVEIIKQKIYINNFTE